MSGFLERLAQRAQGGASLATLPTIRPLPTIYGGAALGNEAIVEMEQLVPGIADALSRGGFIAPGRGTDPVQGGANPSSLQSTMAPVAPNRTEPLRQAAMEPNQRPASLRAVFPEGIELESTSGPDRVTESAARADLPRAVAQPVRQSAVPTRPDGSRPTPAAAPPSDASSIEPVRATPPTHARSGLERLFEAIEAVEDTSSVAGPSAARRSGAPAKLDADSGPLVSIGRITISVAPPPAAPAGPARSHGFDAYARLRGGYER